MRSTASAVSLQRLLRARPRVLTRAGRKYSNAEGGVKCQLGRSLDRSPTLLQLFSLLACHRGNVGKKGGFPQFCTELWKPAEAGKN